MTLKIYLADLTHTGNGIATEAFPLNIGLLASYILKRFGNTVDVTLFKYPNDLLQALRDAPPHLLGCSNYTWNVNLSAYFSRLAKTLNPNIVIVWGGTNYPFDAANQESFLRQWTDVDVHTFYEGEIAFGNIVERMLSTESWARLLTDPLGGCQFLDPSTKAFVAGEALARIKTLDDIPSPYVTGLFDKFFDGVLTPLVETARGCPFKCNFCNAGAPYFSKVNQFSDAYVKEELTYIAQKAAAVDVGHVTFADNNFGMIPRDAKTVEVVHQLQEQYGWPRTMTVWTGKNSKERVIDATRTLGETLNISMSVQSMDPEVQENISRDNIKLEHFRAIAEEVHDQGRPQLAEVIMPLPGETFDKHIHGLNQLLDTKVSRVLSHTLQMLHGTPYKDDHTYVRDHGYQTKWRIVPRDFSEIDSQRIFDVEEVAISTKTFSFGEYVEARKYMLLIELCRNSHIFSVLERYLNERGVTISEWVANVYANLHTMPERVRAIITSFEAETKEELWDSEAEIVAHYSEDEHYARLLSGEAGGNVLFKHRIMLLAETAESFVSTVYDLTTDLITAKARPSDRDVIAQEMEALRRYTTGSVSECYSPDTLDSVLEETIHFDVMAWMENDDATPLHTFAAGSPVQLSFYFRESDKLVLRDAYKRYGTDIKGIIKLIQRIGNSPFRRPIASADVSSAQTDEKTTRPTDPTPAVGFRTM